MRPDDLRLDLPGDVMSTITFDVTVYPRGVWRVRLGLWIMKVGAWVCGCNFHVIEGDGDAA